MFVSMRSGCLDLTEAEAASSWSPIANASLALMKSLLAREGIPARPLRLFTDAACYVGGRGRSHIETFEKNGAHGEEVFRHPHFVYRYLPFFIFGPDLPEPLVLASQDEVRSCGNITSGDIETLRKASKRWPAAMALTETPQSSSFGSRSIATSTRAMLGQCTTLC